ncbi:MAG: rRNA maturation RNase YbeY [Gammaproteobacteria bacterium]|nr:MAG: rRNA maturation RNase YbeY [Gammaproteobacteria bacterium]
MAVTVDLQIAFDDEVPDVEQIQHWAEAALAEVTEDCELSVRLVGDQESADLNSNYRGKMGPTNVLSFPFDSPVPIEPRLLGDLIICVPIVEAEAKQQEKAVSDHWAHMVVHGCLHLLGYDHIETQEAEQMEALEVTILQSLKIDDPYGISEQGEGK